MALAVVELAAKQTNSDRDVFNVLAVVVKGRFVVAVVVMGRFAVAVARDVGSFRRFAVC